MDFGEAMAALKAAGTAQNRKVYQRHGVRPPLFGVSYANQGKIAKAARTDQRLAERLWSNGNHDARILATKIADPSQAKSSLLETWRRDLDDYVLTDAFAHYVAKTPHADSKARRWIAMRAEWSASAGWTVIAIRALAQDQDGGYDALIATIENEIDQGKNRTRHAMNMALIAIGTRTAVLQKKAIAAARRIGKVEVDHGETGCKTPDAEAYILKVAAHRKATFR